MRIALVVIAVMALVLLAVGYSSAPTGPVYFNQAQPYNVACMDYAVSGCALVR